MGWLFVNIIVPLALPPIGVLLIMIVTPKAVRARSEGNFGLMVLVKDGQLGWSAAGMCAAAFYEFAEIISILGRVPSHWPGILIPLVFSTVGAMFVAASGAVYSTEILKYPNFSTKKWLSHYHVFVFSVIITLSSAITLSIVHFTMHSIATTQSAGAK
ncbi:hypothetical protein [Methylobacterium isbiliense]|uniref:hypothetical protein n=1 Tax=Methylobacterium isbiliense TaxID=315478 RepID=UPI001EE1F02B|nr:hypothetical protein [Methylobacterium isbiliense]MDN3624474.1 hypothetical protein [Methylobacterium isbiliense]